MQSLMVVFPIETTTIKAFRWCILSQLSWLHTCKSCFLSGFPVKVSVYLGPIDDSISIEAILSKDSLLLLLVSNSGMSKTKHNF